jgi:hypothetical protein
MKLVQCPDLETYERVAAMPISLGLAAVLGVRADDGAIARELGGGLNAFEDIEAELVSADQSAAGDRRHCVVAYAGRYAPFARAFARWTGRELISAPADFDALPELRAQSIVLIGAPEVFSFSLLSAIARNSCAAEIGILTARSAEALSRRIVRLVYVEDNSVRRNACLGPASGYSAPRSVDDKTTLSSIGNEPLDILIVESHGSSIDVDFPDGVLCGRDSSIGLGALYPCKAGDGCRRNPNGDRLVASIDRIAARVVFSESCNGTALTGGIYPPDTSLALSAMDGPVSAYISAYKLVRSSSGVIPCIAQALLQCGYSFGAVTSIANDVHSIIYRGQPSYVLLGDPRDRLRHGEKALRLDVADPLDSFPFTLECDCGGFTGCVVEITLRLSHNMREHLADASIRVELTPARSPGEGGYAVFLPSQGATARVLVCMTQPRLFRSIRICGQRNAALTEIIRAAWQSIEMLAVVRDGVANAQERRAEWRRCAEDLDDILARARRLTSTAEQSLHSSHPFVTRFHELELTAEWLLRAYSELTDELASKFPDWKISNHLAWTYLHHVGPYGDEINREPCRICGSPCFETEYSSLRAPALRRAVSHCARCGILSDRPANEEFIELRGPEAIPAGGVAAYELKLNNNNSFPLSTVTIALFTHHPRSFQCRFLPTMAGVQLAPRTSATARMSLEVSGQTQPGHYFLVMLICGLLSIHIVSRPLRIDDRRD